MNSQDFKLLLAPRRETAGTTWWTPVRWRWAVIALFAVLVALAGRSAWTDSQDEQTRANDLLVATLIGQQWAMAERAARMAAAPADGANAGERLREWRELLTVTQQGQLALKAAWRRQGGAEPDLQAIGRAPREVWRQAHARLLSSVEAMASGAAGTEAQARALNDSLAAAAAAQSLLGQLEHEAGARGGLVSPTQPVVLWVLAGLGLLLLGWRLPDRSRPALADGDPVRADADGAARAGAALAGDARAPSAQLAVGEPPLALARRAAVEERVRRAMEHATRHRGYGFAVLRLQFGAFDGLRSAPPGAERELKAEISRRLLETLRPGDAVAQIDETAALGPGDGADGAQGYVVVLEGVRDEEHLVAVASRLAAEVAEPYNVLDHPLQAEVHLGVVSVSDPARLAAESAAEVLRDADTAMQEARHHGARLVLFDDSMRERVAQEMAMGDQLRRAIAQHEFSVAYQPVVGLATGSLEGVKATLRWTHPVRGLLLPDQFADAVKEAGLADELALYTVREAAEAFSAWRQSLNGQAPRRLAVPLLRGALDQPGLVQELPALMDACGLEPGELMLELGEGVIPAGVAGGPVLQSLPLLKALGVALALDDFGVGYGTLASLRELPLDAVTIHRSFVAQAATVENHRLLVTAITSLAGTLGLTVIAGGIETPEQRDLMLELGCQQGQGALLGAPMPADVFARWAHA